MLPIANLVFFAIDHHLYIHESTWIGTCILLEAQMLLNCAGHVVPS